MVYVFLNGVVVSRRIFFLEKLVSYMVLLKKGFHWHLEQLTRLVAGV